MLILTVHYLFIIYIIFGLFILLYLLHFKSSCTYYFATFLKFFSLWYCTQRSRVRSGTSISHAISRGKFFIGEQNGFIDRKKNILPGAESSFITLLRYDLRRWILRYKTSCFYVFIWFFVKHLIILSKNIFIYIFFL